MGKSGNPARRVQSLGVIVPAGHRHHRPMPEPISGEHLWVVVGAWVSREPGAQNLLLDAENLLTIEGPACYVCEELYTPSVASRPCAGDPAGAE